jgi:hypothetical protein
MRGVNLDAKRAARAEARGENPIVTLGGREFELVGEMPLALVEKLTSGDMAGAVELLLADADDIDEFMANRPTVKDLEAIAEIYSAGGLGESSASTRSSTSTGKPSRPTSNGSTPSTFRLPAGVPVPSE